MTGERRVPSPESGAEEDVSVYRPVVQVIARLIATDRRAALLASEAGQILLANAPAKALGLDAARLRSVLDWPEISARARRAGSARVAVTLMGQELEGELVALPVGPATGLFLRLSDSEDEATWLRNRARAATLLRVAHDLRTPIQSLLASAEALVTGATAGSGALAGLRRAADLSLAHVSNVLSVLRGEQRGSGLQPDAAFSPAAEVEALVAMLQPLAAQRGAELRLHAGSAGPEQVHGPVRFVRALFQNMLDNAVKHGGAKIEAELWLTPLPKLGPDGEPLLEIRFEVRDLGGGLPPAQRARLQEALGHVAAGNMSALVPATPADARPAQRRSGGLEVLAHALMQLGGTLEIEDRADTAKDGAEVIGTILRARFRLPTAIDIPEPEPEADAERALVGARILVIEDSPASRSWLCQVLRNAGAEVQEAGRGAEALELLRLAEGGPADIVLSDVTLPEFHGVELARRIRAGVRQGLFPAALRIVGLTAHVDTRIRAACLKAGMVEVLEKPIRPGQLCAALAALRGGASDPLDAPLADPADGAAETREPVISLEVVSELARELGRDRALAFMARALAEAEQAMALLRGGLNAASGCALHAATGACGLTGLALAERRLRVLEDAVKAGQGAAEAEMSALAEALERTAAALRDPPF
ncbi:hybrid sensor histidine kinase/response regulator [Salipiger mangrovisoli]|uniref:Response regulator n=1 Tax=Salipiger mangrovisoli TaxID=2865933 RepID=A0ABR9X930_9RHOB|nr:response regulator [Salipiger mangrovisoli]MBE9640104.1 response regulator [Salipiger mangrovisoli]